MFTKHDGNTPGLVTPESDNGLPPTEGQSVKTHSKFTADSTAVADQIARLTRAGHVVHQSGLGDFLVTKYGLSRYCAGFDELKAFAQKVGANHVQS